MVTGAAGFIGSNLVKALNDRGLRDIIAVDGLENAVKFRNIVDCEIVDYIDKSDFRARLVAGGFGRIEAILHQGACSDTTESNGRYMMENNYRYSVDLLDWCQQRKIPFVYASSAAVYGMGPAFREDPANEGPLNVYGYSKFLFDQVVRRRLPSVTAPRAQPVRRVQPRDGPRAAIQRCGARRCGTRCRRSRARQSSRCTKRWSSG